MLVHVVNRKNVAAYGPQTEQMYRQRKKVFVEEMGWIELGSDTPFEIDQFDNEHAHYLLVMDDVGNVLASCRLTATDKPNVTCDVLGHYFDYNPPRDPAIWEVSRWMPGRGDSDFIRLTCAALFIGMAEFALKNNVSALISCSNDKVLTACAYAEIPITKMYTPIRDKCGLATGIHVDVDAELLGHLRRKFGQFNPLLLELSPGAGPNKDLHQLQFALIEDVMAISDISVLTQLHLAAANIIGDHLAEHDDQTDEERDAVIDGRFYQ